MEAVSRMVGQLAGSGLTAMRVIDSHTGGEPTRVIIEGGPDLGSGPLPERKKHFAERFDGFRLRTVLEPKCSEATVGALLCDDVAPGCNAGAIFFNNTGYLDMCGHGTIGLAATLAYLGRLELGQHLIDTPAGIVRIDLLSPNKVTVENVPSYCFRKDVVVDAGDLGPVTGTIAWGGNWFFLVDQSPVPLLADNIPALTEAATRIKLALAAQSIRGADEAEIDHVEFSGPSPAPGVDGRNFVLCPGLAYDRSPCGTGTSAKMAHLAETGRLEPGRTWVQESIIGSRFHGSYSYDEHHRLIPSITGEAFVFADVRLVSQPGDPFEHGIG